MIEAIAKVFRDNEPQLNLVSYSDKHDARFQVLDCDGYRLGNVVFEGVYLLCVITRWRSYGEIVAVPVAELEDAFSWLRETVPEDYLLVSITASLNDSDEQSPLLMTSNKRKGYIVCRSLAFEEETSPGR
jgi:hypothetical protein